MLFNCPYAIIHLKWCKLVKASLQTCENDYKPVFQKKINRSKKKH